MIILFAPEANNLQK